MDKWLNNANISKVIALLLGILLWAIVHMDDRSPNQVSSLVDVKVIDDVRIQTVGLDQSRYILKQMTPEVVRIQVRGQTSALTSAMPEDYRVSLDLTGLGEGKHDIDLTYEMPKGIQLVSMVPSRVTVEIEEMQTKEMDVSIKTTGTPAKGYTVGQPIISPTNRVHVTLPASQMKDIHSVSATLPIDGEQKSVKQKRVKLTAYDKTGHEMKSAIITPPVVEVEVPITKPFKTVPLQINFIGQLPEGLAISSFTPSTNQVAIYGPQDVLDSIDFYDSIQIDLSQFKESTKLTMPLPVLGKVEKIEPNSVNFDITIVPAVQRVLDKLPITLTGASDQLKASIEEPASKSMSITVEGAPDVVNSLKAGDVQVIANLSDLPPGTHQVALQVNLPNFIRRVDPGTIYVKVLIEDKKATPTTKTEPEIKTDQPVDGKPTDTPENGTIEPGTEETTPGDTSGTEQRE
ncbi:CdaR family protein [Paenibacillus guangzhouensis]|uniref:CdaR family protein n=1 Tax=Paenibacillus guangzhouensis TaxID=1473112 RepID=UPI0012672802|nr:CdaR family protein [Paenibacillus guangzhouensis]